jgi:hypothetical protein
MGPSIDELRNVFQHLDQDARTRAHENCPLFGILHWFRVNDNGNSGRVSSLNAGTLAGGERLDERVRQESLRTTAWDD